MEGGGLTERMASAVMSKREKEQRNGLQREGVQRSQIPVVKSKIPVAYVSPLRFKKETKSRNGGHEDDITLGQNSQELGRKY